METPDRIDLYAVHRERILELLRERIVAFAASRYQRDQAEDVAQEVLQLIHEKYPHVVELTELVPLGLRIARFKILTGMRTRVRRGEHTATPVEDANLTDPHEDPEAALARQEMVERLRRALDSLGERCRELYRYKLQGKSFPEIQAILKVASINTVYTWDHRCRKQLLEAMGGSWEEKS